MVSVWKMQFSSPRVVQNPRLNPHGGERSGHVGEQSIRQESRDDPEELLTRPDGEMLDHLVVAQGENRVIDEITAFLNVVPKRDHEEIVVIGHCFVHSTCARWTTHPGNDIMDRTKAVLEAPPWP